MENLGYKILVSIPGYEILQELGRGGMSTVYLAVQESLQRQLALKVMSPTLSVDPSFKDRFMREGRTLGQLSHPNVVIVYDIGLSANRYFIAMEYVGGGTLGELIQQGLPITHSVRIIKAIARALHYAHRRGFVHRDVKPSNILFREDGTPVLADFGIARSVDAHTRLTQTGLSVGTPNYMSPEQVAGQKIDGRSDLYSLGIVFYEMLTGHRPYDGESAIATSLKHLTEPVPTLPQRLIFLQPVMERMLAKAPADRFSDEQEFIEALDRAIAASDSEKPPREQTALSKKPLLHEETGDEQAKPASGQRPAPRPKPAPKTDSGTGAQVWLAAIKRQPRWKLSAGLGTAGVLAAVAAILLSQPALDPATQRAVDHLLRIAERHVTDGQLIAPEGFNAYETYRDILEIAPDYKKALTGLHQIAGHFEAAARTKRKAGAKEESLKLIAQGLKVEPEHAGLLGLRDEISRQLENDKRQREIAALLEKAVQQFGDWRLVEPADDNAAESYRAVLQLDRQNPQALQGLKRIADRLESLARTKQSVGDLTGALEDVEKGLTVDSQQAGLRGLKESLTREMAARERRNKIAKLLDQAAQQLRDGHLVTPPGGNAFESYQQVLNGQPSNEQAQQARAGLRDLAGRLTGLARVDWEAGRVTESLDRIATGLRLFQGLPGYRELQALQEEIERQRKITTLLAEAAQQVKESKLFEPEGENAFASYQEVLKLDPNNATALEGLKAIADRQETVAKRAEAEGDLDKALAAITLGRKAVEDHSSLVSLEAKVRSAIQVREGREKRLARLRAQAEKQLAAGRFTLPAGNNAYESYKEMLAIEPDNEAAKRALQAMVRTLEERAREEQSAGAIQKSLSLVEEARKVDAENPGLLSTSLSQGLLEFRQALLEQIKTLEVERRIATLLDQAHAQLKDDKLTTPPGDNAEASYREVLTLDPRNAQAVAGRRRIVVRLAELAQDRRYAGEFDASLTFIGQGLEIAPEDETLLALKDDVEQRINTRGELAALLDKAEQQMASLKLTRPAGDNAYETLQAVLAIDPDNREAKAALSTIAERYAALARRRRQAGKTRDALAMVERGLQIDPQHRNLLTLKEELAKPPADTKLASLVAQAEQQLAAGRTTTPPGDNAFETLREVLRQEPSNRQAQAGLRAIVAQYEVSIKAQLKKGNLQEGLALAEEGLEFFPEHKELVALQSELAKLQAGQTVASLLARAERQLQAQQWTQPRGNNAFETLQEALRLDPNNRQAQRKLASIPGSCEQRARVIQRQGDTRNALSTVEECLRFFPRDAELIALRDELSQPVDIGAFEEIPSDSRQGKSEQPSPRRRRVFGTF